MEIMLKARTKEHVKTFWEKTQDEEIRRVFPLSVESLEKALKLFEESLKEDALSYGRVIYLDEKYVGDIWCYDIDENNEKMAMLSIIVFEKNLWNKGVATEAANAFVKEVFSKYSINKIGAFTYSSNYGSMGLLKKIGFVEIERFNDAEIESIYFEKRKK